MSGGVYPKSCILEQHKVAQVCFSGDEDNPDFTWEQSGFRNEGKLDSGKNTTKLC